MCMALVFSRVFEATQRHCCNASARLKHGSITFNQAQKRLDSMHLQPCCSTMTIILRRLIKTCCRILPQGTCLHCGLSHQKVTQGRHIPGNPTHPTPALSREKESIVAAPPRPSGPFFTPLPTDEQTRISRCSIAKRFAPSAGEHPFNHRHSGRSSWKPSFVMAPVGGLRGAGK